MTHRMTSDKESFVFRLLLSSTSSWGELRQSQSQEQPKEGPVVKVNKQRLGGGRPEPCLLLH